MKNYNKPNKTNKNIRILIVEDSKAMNFMIHKDLTDLDYSCDSAFTLKEATQLINENVYDYITLDFHLPDGKGSELIKTISDLSKTKIIVFTSSLNEELRKNLFHFGILDYLNKDYSFKDNIREIDKTIKHVEKNRQSSILIVDDSLLIRSQIEKILRPRNYNIFTANNGAQTYEILKKESIDLILLDLELPDIYGLDLLKDIKNHSNEDIPVIIISGRDDSATYRSCLKNGASDFIKKPFIFEELILKVDFRIELNRTNAELENSTKLLEQYKNTVDISAIVSKMDSKGKIVYVNEQYEKITGYKESELIGKNHSIINHPDVAESTSKQMWKTIKEDKKPWFSKVKSRKKDGDSFFVNVVVNPILDQEEKVIEYISIKNDITDIEKTKEHFKAQYSIASDRFSDIMYLSKLYEHAIKKSNIILRMNLDNIITYANDTFYKISGYTQEELIGQPYTYILDSNASGNKIQYMLNHVESGNMWKGDLTILSKAKKPCYFVSTVAPIKNSDGKINEYMFIIQDITEIVTLSKELEETQREVIYKMGEIGETRSKETGNHVKRVSLYSKLLALKAGLDEESATILKNASPMHDIGKVGIPDSILNKPAKLTSEEWEVMKTHSNIGYEILKFSNRPVLQASAIVAHEHHEKYNGNGYPRGLKGEDIHIYGRITAICDVFDALGSSRCYKNAWDIDRIIDEFNMQRGEQFDPKLVDLFLDNLDEFLEIRDKYQ